MAERRGATDPSAASELPGTLAPESPPDASLGPGRQPGWRDVLLVAAVAVGVVLGAAVLTSLLPQGFQRVIFHTPVLILVLILGTGGLLYRIATRRPPEA